MNVKVTTKCGQVEGVEEGASVIFKGIPFAKPPVGDLRWKAPVPVEPWEGVYQADHFAPICPQSLAQEPNPFYKEFYADAAYIREMSEDCLYLNIWVPETAKASDKLPVALYIHGGGFGGGYSSEMEFDGQALNRHGVIFVSIAYRLGVFGFLAHPWLTAESEKKISGNYGIMDQIMALDWIYDNIESFGGDPENITVYGLSAGCMSTQVLVSSPLTEGRISKAILQSGVSCENPMLQAPSLEEGEEYGKAVVANTGVESLDELRALDADQLLAAKNAFDAECFKKYGFDGALRIVPYVDGVVLKKNVRDIYKEGTMAKIPYMVGCVTEDLGTHEEDRRRRVPGLLLDECKAWAAKQEETGNHKAYVYWFDHTLPGDQKPAWHSLELWYTMGTLHRSWRPMTQNDDDLSEECVTYWTNFMKTGDPNGDTVPEWRPYLKKDGFVARLV